MQSSEQMQHPGFTSNNLINFDMQDAMIDSDRQVEKRLDFQEIKEHSKNQAESILDEIDLNDSAMIQDELQNLQKLDYDANDK